MKNVFRKSVCIFLMVVLAIGCCSTFSFAATKTVKMTTYEDCIKSGKYVYCNAPGAIYKVNVKKGTKKILAKTGNPIEQRVASMKLKKGYIYYSLVPFESFDSYLYRVKKSGKSNKKLATVTSPMLDIDFAIKGKRIYYSYYPDPEGDKVLTKKMKLNGKKKAEAKKYKVKTIYKKSNKKGYYILVKSVKENKNDYYLKTPSKQIYLTSVTEE